MARLLRIQRAIRWMAKTLTANRDALPFPKGMTDQVNPVIDIFGSQRAGEMQFAIIAGGLGDIEIFHTQVPDDAVRQYVSMQWVHNDGATRSIRPGRIVLTATGFPFIAFESEKAFGPLDFQAARNITVGPLQRLAITADAMGAAARMTLTVLWLETPLGEYVRSIE